MRIVRFAFFHFFIRISCILYTALVTVYIHIINHILDFSICRYKALLVENNIPIPESEDEESGDEDEDEDDEDSL